MNMRDIITKLDEITALQPGVKIFSGDNITPQQITHNYDMVKQGKAKLDVSDHISNFANDAANALSFGYADNVASALDATFDKNKTYAGQMAKYKANAKGYGDAGPSVHVPDSIPLIGGGNITPGDLAGLFTGAGLIKGGAQIGAKLLGKTVGKYAGGTAAFLAPAVGHAVVDPAEQANPANQLMALQKVIGAKPDGVYGPETKEKLAAWQKQNGLNPDGIPGSRTYTKMAQSMSANLPATAEPAPATESKKGNNMKKITESELKARVDRLNSILAEDGGYDAMGNVTTAEPSASPTAVAKGWPSTPAAIKAFQTANKLTPDGMIGNLTLAALQRAGYTPPAGFKPVGNKAPQKPTPGAQTAPAAQRTPAEIAASADLSSANNAGNINAGLTPDDPRWQGPKPTPAAQVAPAAPAGMQAVGDDEGNTTITRPDGSTMVVGADGKQIMPGSNPNLPQNKGIVNTIKNAVTGQGDFQKPTGFIPGQAPAPAVAPAPAPAPAAANQPKPAAGKPGETAQAQAAATAGAPVTPQNDPAMKNFMGETTFQNDELSRIVSLVRHR
jgi:peptidoglycan hydrolase-like protein with peptidoglycan-binding domain